MVYEYERNSIHTKVIELVRYGSQLKKRKFLGHQQAERSMINTLTNNALQQKAHIK